MKIGTILRGSSSDKEISSLTKFHYSILFLSSKMIRNENGFIYESIKDVLCWNKINPKDYINMFSQIGIISVMGEEQFKGLTVENPSIDQLASMLGVTRGAKKS